MKTIITIVSLLLSATAFAGADYIVKTEVLKEQSSLGSPTVALESGVSAKVSVEGNYNLSLTVSPDGERNVFLKTQLEVGEESHNPSMMVELDKETKVTINDNTTLIVTVKKA